MANLKIVKNEEVFPKELIIFDSDENKNTAIGIKETDENGVEYIGITLNEKEVNDVINCLKSNIASLDDNNNGWKNVKNPPLNYGIYIGWSKSSKKREVVEYYETVEIVNNKPTVVGKFSDDVILWQDLPLEPIKK